ncbi:DUF3443 domain-containing protein [Paraburkholderia bryophila]|uniref:DUF3443 domain-containing protein n=1 Tax=Burkholderiaceae TaxID=119060 RepID=UPI0005500B75|nr:DUF3443 domain-containing protein [Burkholderia sp. 9120]
MRTMRIAMKGMTPGSWIQAVAAVMLMSVLVACGGGGGSGGSSSSGGSSALNGGSLPPSPNQTPIVPEVSNTAPIAVGPGLSSVANLPMVSVTICVPGGTPHDCQDIDNVQLDTGSFGLRLVAAKINPALLQTFPISTINGTQLAECANFADGYTWGTVRTAVVAIGGEETTNAIPIQIIGDLLTSSTPTQGCSGTAENTAADLGASGILGIGPAPVDCGATCATPSTAATYSNYFVCPGGVVPCSRATVPVSQQVANPVANFPTNNNGVIVQLPAVPDTGASSVSGTLVFGVNTQSNNIVSSSAQNFITDQWGNMNHSVYNGATVQAFLDSGSNAYFFFDNTLTQCGSNYAGFYCPPNAQTRSVTLGGQDIGRGDAVLGILSASTLFGSSNNLAFRDLAGQLGANGEFDLGLPFFFGRYVYYGFDQTATGGPAPFVAF